MTRTQLYLADDQIGYLRQRAARENITMSELIRQILENCDEKKPKKSASEALLGLADLGRKHKVKAPKDLASNIDQYLYGQ